MISLLSSVHATSFYISPNGLDTNTGLNTSVPIQSFNHAWQLLYPGDTLYVMDGLYKDTVAPNIRNGETGKPITIKAVHDGQAVVDGEGVRVPLQLGDMWPGPIGNYFVVEGIVFKNALEHVVRVIGFHNVLRRISAYNADPDKNAQVFLLSGDDILNEDCIAAGSGRKMIEVNGTNVTVRRCVAYGTLWRGNEFCNNAWPWIDGIQIYNGNNNVIENNITFGPYPVWGLSVQANDPNAVSDNNVLSGNAVIGTGYADLAGTQWVDYYTASALPQPNTCNRTTSLLFDNHSVGFQIWGQGKITNNTFKDIIALNSSGLGYSNAWPSTRVADFGNSTDRFTMINNGAHNTAEDNRKAGSLAQANLGGWPLTNSLILKNYDATNTVVGARLQNMYIGGTLTSQSLWPWPMDSRVTAEFGSVFGKQNFSITNNICRDWLAKPGVNAVTNCGTSGVTTTPPSPTTALTPTSALPKAPCVLTGDTNVCDGKVDILDYSFISGNFASSNPKADVKPDGKIDILDYTVMSNNFGKKI